MVSDDLREKLVKLALAGYGKIDVIVRDSCNEKILYKVVDAEIEAVNGDTCLVIETQ